MGDEQSMILPAMDCFASLSSGRPLRPGPWVRNGRSGPDLRSSLFDCRLHSPTRRNSVRRKGDDQAHGLPDIGWLFAQSIPDADVGSISHMIRTSPGRAKGYLSFPRYFFASESMCSAAPSSVALRTRPRIWR